MSSFRIDKDSLGEAQVPSDAYYGAFTARAKQHYNVTGQKAHINLVKAYIMIKRSGSNGKQRANALDQSKADAIIKACDEVLSGKLLDQFVIEEINSGAGTAFNMNCNEVIANRAIEILDKKKGEYEIINPNDHVNMSQSSNDTFPTAMHVAILLNMRETMSALDRLILSLEMKARQFRGIIKIGRTHLMDALPVTLETEFEEYAYSLKQAQEKLIRSERKPRICGPWRNCSRKRC